MSDAPNEIRSADVLVDLLRVALISEGVSWRTPEIALAPDPRRCWLGFLSFCGERVESPSGAIVEDVVQIESSEVAERLDPDGMHRWPGPYRATWSRRITVADVSGEAIRIHEAALQIYFGAEAIDLGRTFSTANGASAPTTEASRSSTKSGDDPSVAASLIRAGEPSALLDLPTQQAVLAASELYDYS